MTEEQIREHLKGQGWPQHVWQGGSKLLIARWTDFVARLEDQESSRNWLIDDYWIFLEIRELIHEIGHDADVIQADEIFRSMLVRTDIKHRHKDRKSEYDFWNYGYPKNASGFFFQQIRLHVLQES